MDLIERIDARLLDRSSRLVAWNRDRGRANQWEMALAALDIGIACLALHWIVDLMDGAETSTSLFHGALVTIFWFNRKRERREIEQLACNRMGGAIARVQDARLRQVNIVVDAAALVLCAMTMERKDAFFLLGVYAFNGALYLKAADPPPPARRVEHKTATAGA